MTTIKKKSVIEENIEISFPSFFRLGEIIFLWAVNENTYIIITDFDLESSIKRVNEIPGLQWEPSYEIEFKTHFNNVKYKLKRVCGED